MDKEQLRILIADDNDSDRLILQTIVRKQGHTVYPARDGVEAVELFEKERPDLVLMDALMPNMDGFEAARRIKSLAGESLVPIIFLTSLKDATSLADCLEAGGDDFLSKPYNRIILQAKIRAFARMQRLHAEVAEQRDQISVHNDRLVQEQEVAKAVFDNIAHPGCIDAPNIRYLLSPMAVFNGDMVLAARRPSGGMHVLLGDFTGHGLPAAIGAMPASEIFYGMTSKGFSAQEIVREINKKLKSILPVGVFCCACMVDISFRKGMIEVWMGGLPDTYIYRIETGEVELVKSTNLPLGVLGDKQFKSETQVFHMELGDRMFLWSDGIHEAVDSEDNMFGSGPLQKVFEDCENPDQLFDDILKGVDEFTGYSEQDDDHTLVELKMMTEEELVEVKPKEWGLSASGGPLDWSLSLELRPQALREFNPLPLVTHILMEVPGLHSHSTKLYTILSELYLNALEHGVMELSSNLKSTPAGFAEYYMKRTERLAKLEDGCVRFDFEHSPTEEGGRLLIRLTDTGDGFDHETKIDGQMEEKRGFCGRGIPLLNTMCESIEYKDPGNQVEVVFAWVES